MGDRMRSCSWYIVLPPGHGKSVLHNPEIGLYGSDEVLSSHGTVRLRSLREEAKVTGNWTPYDQEWGWEISRRLPPGSVLMVQSSVIGLSAGCHPLGGVYLDPEVWAVNLSNRKGSTKKYQSSWDACVRGGGIRSENNEQTTNIVMSWVKQVRNVEVTALK